MNTRFSFGLVPVGLGSGEIPGRAPDPRRRMIDVKAGKRGSVRCCLRASFALSVSLLLPTLGNAAETSSLLFQTQTSQSMWETGAGLGLDFQHFFGVPYDVSGSFTYYAGIGSATISGRATGRVGVDVDLHFGTGLVDAAVPFSAGLDFNYTRFSSGTPVTINTVANNLATGAQLNTRFPELNFASNLVFEMTPSISASGCVGIPFVYSECGGMTLPSTILPAISLRPDLLTVNKRVDGVGDGEINLLPDLQKIIGAVSDTRDTKKKIDKDLSKLAPDAPTKAKVKAVLENLVSVGLAPLAEVDARLPEIATKLASVQGGVLTSTRVKDDFLDLSLDVDGLLTATGLLPVPLELQAKFGTGVLSADVRVNLADITLTDRFFLEQEFTLEPTALRLNLAFDRPVQAAIRGTDGLLRASRQLNGDTWVDGALVGDLLLAPTISSLDGLSAGIDQFDLVWDDQPLIITPTYTLEATLNNKTYLGVDLILDVELLSASAAIKVGGYNVASPSLGPLYEEEFNLSNIAGNPDLLTQTVFDETFKFGGFGAAQGTVIKLDTSDAVFIGTGTAWNATQNWMDGRIGKNGLSVTIDASNAAGSPAGGPAFPPNVVVQGSDNFVVGDLTTGSDIEVDVRASAVLTVSGALVNAGTITVSGQLGVLCATFPNCGPYGELKAGGGFGGGGEIVLAGGKLSIDNSVLSFVSGQDVRGYGEIDVTPKQLFYLFPGSDIVADGGSGTYLNLDIGGNPNFSNLGGTLAAENQSVLNIFFDPGARVIHNSGFVRADNRGSVIIGHSGLAADNINSSIEIHGGALITSEGGKIVVDSDVILSGTPHFVGRAESIGSGQFQVSAFSAAPGDPRQLSIYSDIINDGNILVNGTTYLRGEEDTITFSGSGIATFLGNINPVLQGPDTLVNGPDHTMNVTGAVMANFPYFGTLVNEGLFVATGATGATRDIVNSGSIVASNSTFLQIWGQLTNTDEAYLSATGGYLTIRGAIADGATSGPRGTFAAVDGGRMVLVYAATQWRSLIDADAAIEGGAIELYGAGSQFYWWENGTVGPVRQLYSELDRIGANGRLGLFDHTFQRGGATTSATVNIDGELELRNGQFIADAVQANGNGGHDGVINIAAGARVRGYGLIKANTFTNQGLVQVDERTSTAAGPSTPMTIVGNVSSFGGTFEVMPASRLHLDLTSCGSNCTLLGSGGTELNGGNFILNGYDGGGAFGSSEVRIFGAGPLAISTLRNSSVTLIGPVAVFATESPISGNHTLAETLTTLDAGTLVLSGARQAGFDGFVPSNDIALHNASILRMEGSAVFDGNELTVDTNSKVQLGSDISFDVAGEPLLNPLSYPGVLKVDRLTLRSGAVVEGHGALQGPNTPGLLPDWTIDSDRATIRADDGILNIHRAAITQSVFGVLEATAINQGPGDAAALASGLRDRVSILTLSRTDVDNGQLRVGAGAQAVLSDVSLSNMSIANAGILLNGATIGPFTVSSFSSIHQSTLVNAADSILESGDGKLFLENSEVINTDGTVMMRVVSSNTGYGNAELQLSNSVFTDGSLELISTPELSAPIASDPSQESAQWVPQADDVSGYVEIAPTNQAVLRGWGRFTDVDLLVDAWSLVDADVSGRRLAFDIGAGSITNFGTMRASNGGILELSCGALCGETNATVGGTGVVLALAGSVVEIRNIDFDGVSLSALDGGIIRDIESSTFINMSNNGNFEVAGRATLAGNVNNSDGLIRVLNGGVIEIAEGPSGQVLTASGEPIDSDVPTPFSLNQGTLVVDAGGFVNGAGGTLRVNHATLSMNGGTVASSAGPVNLAGASLLTGTGMVNASVVNSSASEVVVGAGHNLRLGGEFNENSGLVEVSGGGDLRADGLFDNAASGDIFINGGTARFNGGLSNAGDVNVSFGGATLFGDITNLDLARIILSGNSETTFNGALLNEGELRVSAGSVAVFFGDVKGSGSYTSTGTKFYEAGFSPGSSPGLVLDEGDATFGRGSVIDMDIAGVLLGEDYDHYRVNGELGLGGTLRVHLLDGFAPTLGDAFDLFDAAVLDGAFAAFDFNQASLAAGLRWDLSALSRTGVLSVAAVPLPAGLWLLLSGLAGISALRCRQQHRVA